MFQIRNGRATGLFAGALASAALLQVSLAEAATEMVMHSFQNNGVDGTDPEAGLIDVGGTFYGVTHTGGANGEGAVFKIAPKTGAEKVVYSFQNNGADGTRPANAGLIDVKGTLYGTTYLGGTANLGAVFKFSPATGKEKVVYSFCGGGGSCTDGYYPVAGLTDIGGTLYGTTSLGGTDNAGTVFSVSRTTGTEAVIYSFKADGMDGRTPYGALVDVGGTLYGTTIAGGARDAGTVFRLNPATGAETVLYTFVGGTDGREPYAGLIDVKGTLYGTTYKGGADDAGSVFKINSRTGAETVLYSFIDFGNPIAGVIFVKGTLYGTTYMGGGGSGNVFKLNPTTGAETVLYSFVGGTDGAGPQGWLIDVGGTLYGTTVAGGAYGSGTVFKIQ